MYVTPLPCLRCTGVRSIVLTSGTLSPLDSFKEDMRIHFTDECTLVNPHVIQSNQIWIGCSTVGPTGVKLNSKYSSRSTKEYKDELGLSILAICQTAYGRTNNHTVANLSNCDNGNVKGSGQGSNMTMQPASSVPPPELRGGILIFFPSYGVMEESIRRWRETGLWDRLKVHGAEDSLVVEPRGGSNISSARSSGAGHSATSSTTGGENTNNLKKTQKVSFINNNNSGVHSGTGSSGGGGDRSRDDDSKAFGETMIQLESALKRFGTCLLFAVCRGKVSEGIDFR